VAVLSSSGIFVWPEARVTENTNTESSSAFLILWLFMFPRFWIFIYKSMAINLTQKWIENFALLHFNS
jgi:hypothetical protein